MHSQTKGREMSHAEKVKFDAAMTQLDAAVIRARLQPMWEKAKREAAFRKADRAAMSVRLDEGRL